MPTSPADCMPFNSKLPPSLVQVLVWHGFETCGRAYLDVVALLVINQSHGGDASLPALLQQRLLRLQQTQGGKKVNNLTFPASVEFPAAANRYRADCPGV